jgi:hypothetical protein
MCCEHLICARCAGPVAEGRCASCSAARADLHATPGAPGLQAIVLLTLLVLVLLALLLRAQVG